MRGIIERLKRLEEIAPDEMHLLCNVDGELKELTHQTHIGKRF